MVLAVAVLAAALLGGGPAGRTGQGELDIRVVRFYQADIQRTRIKAFVSIPFRGLMPGGDGRLTLKIKASVTDSGGMVLSEDSWTSRPRSSSILDRASSVEMLDFVVAPGQYSLAVEVTDSVSGRRETGRQVVEAFATEPVASDLMATPLIRPVEAGDTVPQPGEWRYGTETMVTAATTPQLTPGRPQLYYLVEAYTPAADSGSMLLSVVDTGGKALVRTRAQALRLPAGGGVMKGSTDLTGLPEGHYFLEASLTIGDRKIQRTAPFSMGSLEDAVARDMAYRKTDEGYFAVMTVQQLDEARAPLDYVARSGEMEAWSNDLSQSAKARFLTAFWQRRDPTPGTAQNEAREQFYLAINTANARYQEAGRQLVPGWQTDRGRIYLKMGEPEDIHIRPNMGRDPEVEAWNYLTKNRQYIFFDQHNNGVFRLMYSNDLSEVTLENWYLLIGTDGLEELGQFLGVDFRTKYNLR
jgi:GWxTD domain-containing protein